MRIKIVPVGDKCSGSSTYSAKTSLLQSFTTLASDKEDRPFYRVAPEYLPTVFENYDMQIVDRNGDLVMLSLWDTAGMVSESIAVVAAKAAAASRTQPLAFPAHYEMSFTGQTPSCPAVPHLPSCLPSTGRLRANPEDVVLQHQRLSPRL